MIRYLRLLHTFAKFSFLAEMEYRVNFAVNMLYSALLVLVGLTMLQVFFGVTNRIGGWTYDEALCLFGVFIFFEGVIGVILVPNLSRLSEYIRLGTLDFILLKPVNSLFYVSFRNVNIWKVPETLTGLAIVIYGMVSLDVLTPANLGLLVALLMVSMVTIYAIWVIISSLAFWFIGVDNINQVFLTFFSAGRLPVTAYPVWAQILLTYIVPIALLTTVPSGVIAGKLDYAYIGYSVTCAAFLLGVSRLVWTTATRKYASASS
jgi:ABC-2 type transport system permease protein